MHYANGQETKAGDLVIHSTSQGIVLFRDCSCGE
jgi:hypothetical protein